MRRYTGHNLIEQLRLKISGAPTWVLAAVATGTVGVMTGTDLSVYVPVIGLVSIPFQFIDQYIVGLPTILIGFELYERWKANPTEIKRLEDSTSRSGE